MKNKLRKAGISIKDMQQKKKLANELKNKKSYDVKNMNTLKYAQKSTASMGVHEKKSSKYEPEIERKRKTKVNNSMTQKAEKEQSMKVLANMKRSTENQVGKVNKEKIAKFGV